MMIKIYDKNETLFDNNGIKVLHPLKCVVFKEDNGDYNIEVESTLKDLEYLQEGFIIRVPTRWGEQGFRLTNPTIKNKKIIVKGKHLYFDSSRYVIADSYVVDKNCNDALDHLNMATDNPSPFTTISDISTKNSCRIIRKTLEEAIATVVEKWNGHLERNNFTIEIHENIGQDRGVVVKYGKNIQEIEAKEIWDSVVTKIMPVGHDGITLPEIYLYSDMQYDIPYTKIVKFEQEIDQNNFKDDEGNLDEERFKQALTDDLRKQAKEYLEEHQYLQCNYKLKAHIENIADIGDVVYVDHEQCNIRLKTNVISVKYDVLQDRYTEIEFGNFKMQLKNLISSIKTDTKEKISESATTVTVKLEKELNEATSKIWGTLGDSFVIYEGDKILVVDKLPKEEAVNCMMINSGGIGFSTTGINGTFNSAWTIDGTLDMQVVHAINMTADIVKGGTLKVGSTINEAGRIEIYDISNKLIGTFDDDGICIFGDDGSKVVISSVEFAGYDRNGNRIFWINGDEFHMKKSVVEEEITIASRIRIIPIDVDTNTGIGFVALI